MGKKSQNGEIKGRNNLFLFYSMAETGFSIFYKKILFQTFTSTFHDEFNVLLYLLLLLFVKFTRHF